VPCPLRCASQPHLVVLDGPGWAINAHLPTVLQQCHWQLQRSWLSLTHSLSPRVCSVVLLPQDIQVYRGSWPQRVYVGMGGKEYSGVRSGRGREHDAHFPRYLKSLYAALTEQGLGPDRLAWSYDPSAAHTESAWAERLPEALSFVAQGWWANWLQRHSGSKLLTSPGQLVAGVEGQLLFFNRSASSSLRNTPRGRPMKVTMGVDGWQQAQQLQLEPLQTGLHHHIDPPAALQQEVFEAWGLDPGLQDQLHQRLLDTVKGSKATAAAGAAAGGDAGEDWCVLRLPAPPQGCSRLDMAFCGAYVVAAYRCLYVLRIQA